MSAGNVLRRWSEALKQGMKIPTASADVLKILPETTDTGTIQFGDGTFDIDFKVFLGSATEYVHFDVGSSNVRFNVPLRLDNNTGAGGGECLRALTSIDGNTGTAHGFHAGLSFLATAGGSECSGLGAAVRGTLHIPDVASWAPTGTYAAGYFEIYSDGTASDPAGMTELACLTLGNNGNATGAADVDTDAYVISLPGWSAASGVTNAISSTSLAELPAGTIGIRVKFNSTMYYIPAVVSTQWN